MLGRCIYTSTTNCKLICPPLPPLPQHLSFPVLCNVKVTPSSSVLSQTFECLNLLPSTVIGSCVLAMSLFSLSYLHLLCIGSIYFRLVCSLLTLIFILFRRLHAGRHRNEALSWWIFHPWEFYGSDGLSLKTSVPRRDVSLETKRTCPFFVGK